MKWTRKLDKNVYEIRSQETKNIQKCLYFMMMKIVILLHMVSLKNSKISPREIQHVKELRVEYHSRKDNES